MCLVTLVSMSRSFLMSYHLGIVVLDRVEKYFFQPQGISLAVILGRGCRIME